MCSTNKLSLGCTSHRVSETVLYTSVMIAINAYCKNISELSSRLSEISLDEIEPAKLEKIEKSQRDNTAEIEDLRRTISVVEKRCGDNLGSKNSCDEICADIRLAIEKLEFEIIQLSAEKASINHEMQQHMVWIKAFAECGDLKKLNRAIMANLIETI